MNRKKYIIQNKIKFLVGKFAKWIQDVNAKNDLSVNKKYQFHSVQLNAIQFSLIVIVYSQKQSCHSNLVQPYGAVIRILQHFISLK